MDKRGNLVNKLINWFVVLYYKNCGITIGKGTIINVKSNLDVRRGSIIIGENVFIDRDCIVLSHIGSVPQNEKTKPTIIKDGVFLFNNVTVYPEITIGKNSLIYPGSVVTKNIPPNSIVLGNPGKIISNIDDKDNTITFGGIENENT